MDARGRLRTPACSVSQISEASAFSVISWYPPILPKPTDIGYPGELEVFQLNITNLQIHDSGFKLPSALGE